MCLQVRREIHLRVLFYLIQFLLAENDCQRALELEPGNVKAMYRRAVARKVSPPDLCTLNSP